MKKKFRNQSKNKTFDFLRYLGPGLLVTVGFIDPGNWASNIAAGSGFGYELLWMVTLKAKGEKPEIENYPLHPLRDVRKKKGTLDEIIKEAQELSKQRD